jgi:hypothetical protein
MHGGALKRMKQATHGLIHDDDDDGNDDILQSG